MLSRDFAIADICSMMAVSRSGYYKWKRCEPSMHDLTKEAMVEVVEQIHTEHPPHGYRWTAAYIRHNLNLIISDNFAYKCFLRYLDIQSQTHHKVHSKPRKVRDDTPSYIFHI